ncbi:irc3 [Symbiodinium sp. CCMP2592]|nr:irc3 [Symbiodinium sp. CCMP2592]
MERLRGLASEALAWPFLEDEQRLIWAAVLEFDAVPTQELPPWFFERHNFTRRRLGVDLFSLDGQQAILCRAGNSTGKNVKRFLRTAHCVLEAPRCTLWTDRGCNIAADSQRWLQRYGGQRKILTKKRLRQLCRDNATSVLTFGQATGDPLPDPPLRPCQEACLEACAKGARVIEMACGTGKTRVICELAAKQTGKVLVMVPSRVLLEQFAVDLPGFCKVGMRYNDNINMQSRGFIAVTDSVHFLDKLEFAALLVDEAHHPLPKGCPSCSQLFKFSATHAGEVDFRYSLGEAIGDGVLCDYDLTVPVTTEGHPYICLANLLVSQAGRFRRVLAYCNTLAEAKRFRQVLETVGLAAWHINGHTSRKERERVMNEFSDDLLKTVHVLVTVQVLGEGVNIPNADTCMFVEPRSSYVSIIQAIGRVLRPHPSKPLAHIVLPAVVMPATAGAAHREWGDMPGTASRTESRAPDLDAAQHGGILESPAIPTQVRPGATAFASSQAAAQTENRHSILGQPSVQPGQTSRKSATQTVDGLVKRHRSKLATNKLEARSCRPRLPLARLRDDSSGDTEPKSLLTSQLPRSGSGCGMQSDAQGSSKGDKGSEVKLEDTSLHSPLWKSDSDGTEARDSSPKINNGWSGHGSEQELGLPNRILRPASGHMGSSSEKLEMAEAAAFEAGPVIWQQSAAVTRPVHEAESTSLSISRPSISHLQAASPNRPAVSHNAPASTSRKLKVNRAFNNTGLFGRESSGQLDRFLEAIAKADSRFPNKDVKHLQSRLWVANCQLLQGVLPEVLVRSLQYSLALILQQHDPWEVRLREVDDFVQDHGRLPRESTDVLTEKALAVWLRTSGYRVRRHGLSAAKMQKLLNVSSPEFRARVARWLDPETRFQKFLKELREFVRAQRRMPINKRKERVQGEYGLAQRLNGFVGFRRKDRERRLELLNKQGPLVEKWVASRRARKPPQVYERRWKPQLKKLVDFLDAHGRMPRSGHVSERAMCVWICRQRSNFDRLSTDLRAELVNSHSEVASFLRS